jgi:hypothetical protein
MDALEKLCGVVGNKDIEVALPKIMSCIARPEEVTKCIHLLSATTFVQAVEAPALSVMVPLLLRGLRIRETAIKRKSALIIDNMSKVDYFHHFLSYMFSLPSPSGYDCFHSDGRGIGVIIACPIVW